MLTLHIGLAYTETPKWLRVASRVKGYKIEYSVHNPWHPLFANVYSCPYCVFNMHAKYIHSGTFTDCTIFWLTIEDNNN